jgi:Ribbon-helix-helix protein, copG family.
MTNKPVFTLRMDDELLKKIKAIAQLSKRSTSMQIEYAVEKFIQDYEKVNGSLDV